MLRELRFLRTLSILITSFILPLILWANSSWLLLFTLFTILGLLLLLPLWSLLLTLWSLSFLLRRSLFNLLFWDWPWLEWSTISVKCLFFSTIVRSIFWLRRPFSWERLRRRLEDWLGISEWILIFCLLWLLKLLGIPNWRCFGRVEQRVLCFSTNNNWVRVVFALMHFMLKCLWHLPALVDWMVFKESCFWIPVILTMAPCFFLLITVVMVMFSNYRYWNIDMLSCICHWFIVDVGASVLNGLVIDMSHSVLNWFKLSMCCVVSMALFWVVVMWTFVMIISDMGI